MYEACWHPYAFIFIQHLPVPNVLTHHLRYCPHGLVDRAAEPKLRVGRGQRDVALLLLRSGLLVLWPRPRLSLLPTQSRANSLYTRLHQYCKDNSVRTVEAREITEAQEQAQAEKPAPAEKLVKAEQLEKCRLDEHSRDGNKYTPLPKNNLTGPSSSAMASRDPEDVEDVVHSLETPIIIAISEAKRCHYSRIRRPWAALARDLFLAPMLKRSLKKPFMRLEYLARGPIASPHPPLYRLEGTMRVVIQAPAHTQRIPARVFPL